RRATPASWPGRRRSTPASSRCSSATSRPTDAQFRPDRPPSRSPSRAGNRDRRGELFTGSTPPVPPSPGEPSMMTDKDAALAAAGVRSESPTTWKTRLKQAARAYTVPTSRLRPLPEFLIIGAQRTGTTSLYKYLYEHPQFVSATLKTKGVHFFDMRYDKGMAWYRAHFPTSAYRAFFRARHGCDLVTGEASPYYLFHPHVPYRLAQHMPDVKLIAMLRDPIERTYSMWQHELSRGFEHLDRFEDALDAEEKRLAGEIEKMNADPDYTSFSHQHHS